jgi:hypothetical protein
VRIEVARGKGDGDGMSTRRQRIALGMREMGCSYSAIDISLGCSGNGSAAGSLVSRGWDPFAYYCHGLRIRGQRIIQRICREVTAEAERGRRAEPHWAEWI